MGPAINDLKHFNVCFEEKVTFQEMTVGISDTIRGLHNIFRECNVNSFTTLEILH